MLRTKLHTGQKTFMLNKNIFIKYLEQKKVEVLAQDIARDLQCDRHTCVRHLNALLKDGKVNYRKVGAYKLWSIK